MLDLSSGTVSERFPPGGTSRTLASRRSSCPQRASLTQSRAPPRTHTDTSPTLMATTLASRMSGFLGVGSALSAMTRGRACGCRQVSRVSTRTLGETSGPLDHRAGMPRHRVEGPRCPFGWVVHTIAAPSPLGWRTAPANHRSLLEPGGRAQDEAREVLATTQRLVDPCLLSHDVGECTRRLRSAMTICLKGLRLSFRPRARR